MQVDEAKWQRLLRAQHGVATYAQALSCGWTRDAIAHRRGRFWQRLLPGVLLTVTGEATRRQQLEAALLHAGPAAALTGATACALHGLDRAPVSELVHVAAPAASAVRSAGFVRVWPTTRPFQAHPVDGVRTVSVPRAVVDAALTLRRLNDVRALVAEAVQRGRTTCTELARELQAAPVKGSRLLRLALGEVTAGARSAPEAVLVRALDDRDGTPPYELNVELYDDGGRWLARPDLVFRSQRVVVEVDGVAWHLSPERWAADLERQRRLTAAGWTVLRYPAARVLSDAAGVAAEIVAFVATR